jgi:hypothetical protein
VFRALVENLIEPHAGSFSFGVRERKKKAGQLSVGEKSKWLRRNKEQSSVKVKKEKKRIAPRTAGRGGVQKKSTGARRRGGGWFFHAAPAAEMTSVPISPPLLRLRSAFGIGFG